jgi:hypothetical protein
MYLWIITMFSFMLKVSKDDFSKFTELLIIVIWSYLICDKSYLLDCILLLLNFLLHLLTLNLQLSCKSIFFISSNYINWSISLKGKTSIQLATFLKLILILLFFWFSVVSVSLLISSLSVFVLVIIVWSFSLSFSVSFSLSFSLSILRILILILISSFIVSSSSFLLVVFSFNHFQLSNSKWPIFCFFIPP